MKVQGSSLFKGFAGAVLLAASVLTACNKEDVQSPVQQASDATAPTEKTPYCLFRMYGGSAPFQFNVTYGTDGAYGTLINTGGTSAIMPITSQTGTTLYATGTTSPCGGLTDASNCAFSKNSSGSWYYVTPNQGPGVGKLSLKFRVKSGVTVPTRATWFSYDVNSNTWNWDPTASTYFDYSTVTSFTTLPC